MAISEATDNLKSKATLTLLDLLGEGPIGGLVNGAKSVYFNDTQLQNDDGTYNFQGVTTTVTNGSNDQRLSGNFGNFIETPYNVSTQVKTAQPYTFSIVNPLADAVRVIVNFPSLSSSDPNNGNINGSSVSYKFQMSINGEAFTDLPVSERWVEGGDWLSTGTTHFANTEFVTNITGVRASIRATVNDAYRTFGAVRVQPQEFNDNGEWVNLGAEREITVYASVAGYAYADENGSTPTSYTFSSDEVVVESKFSQVRFVQTYATPWASLVEGKIEHKEAVSTITVTGKSRSKYQRKHVFNIPRPAESVEMRMVRITPDSTTALVSNDIYLDSYYEIIKLNLNYPNSALFGFTADAQQFTQIPNRSYLVDGLYINVPVNYNTETRTYSGVWNGQFKLAVSNNPAWILYDVLTNARYGLGTYINAQQVDHAMLYTVGRYCDELVPDGYGGYEPRFTLNTQINSRQEAYKLVSDIASAFRGMMYWANGMASFTQDAPTGPTMIYGRANVINGEFTYTGSARKDRHSVVHVTWNDPDENYKKKIEYVEDPELVQAYGVRKLDTLAFGTTSRGQASRVGKWILYTEKYESDFVTFKVGLDSAFVAPGQVIKIQDPARAGRRVAGRLLSCDLNEAHLDAETQIDARGTISIMMPDGTFVDRVLNESDGAYATVTWNTPLPARPENNAMWLIQEENLTPILARVVAVGQSNATEFEITAVEHNPDKYAAIETGLALTDRRTSIIDPTFINTPVGLTITESRYLAAPGVVANKLLVSWYGDSSRYELTYRGISDTNASNPIKVTVEDALTYEILNAAVGTYSFSITAINPLGRRSGTVSSNYTAIGKSNPPSKVPYFNAVANDQGILLEWTPVADIDLKAYELRLCDYHKQPWDEAKRIGQASSVSTTFTTTALVAGSYMFYIKALDTWDRYSGDPTWATIDILNPNTPAVTASFAQNNCKLTWASAKTSYPVTVYEVRYGESFEAGAVVGRTSDESISIPAMWTGSRTFWVRASDGAGNKSTAGSVVVTITAPSVSDLSVTTVADRYRLSWSSVAGSLPVSQFEVRVGASSDTWATATALTDLSANSYEGKVDWLGVKKFFVAALDASGGASEPFSVTLNIGAPASPAMVYEISGTNATLSWPTPTLGTLPLNEYEVREGSGDFDSASVVSKLKGNSLTIPVTWTGDKTFQIIAKDVAGNQSAVNALVVPVNVPAAPIPSGSYLADLFLLAWNAPDSTLPITEYEVRHGTVSDTWASSASSAIRVKATVFSTSAQWSGTRRWWVAGVDANGNVGQPGQVDTIITAPSAPSVTRSVVDNNVLLYWSESTGTLPVATYELRRGENYETAVNIGKKAGGFTTVFETASGTYTYWLVAIDTAGNYGTPAFLTVTVDQPPDYVLKDSTDLDFTGTMYHMAQDTDGSWIMPVNTTETFAEHFTTHAWQSPNDQIAGGYEVFIEPATAPGYYEQIIDYGATLTSTKITVTPSGQVVAGSPDVSITLSVRNQSTDPWIDHANTSSLFAVDFRYVKVRLTVTGGGTDLYRLNGINVKLDTKRRTDAGSGVAGASDSVSGTSAVINGVSITNANPLNDKGHRVPDGAGTLVRFEYPFVDITAIDISVAAGSSAKYGLYDFVDGPYPAGFKVLLFDAAGNRVAGAFSWGAKGL